MAGMEGYFKKQAAPVVGAAWIVDPRWGDGGV